MDISKAIADMPNVKRLSGLSEAWIWSPSPRFTFAGALRDDGSVLFQMNCFNGFDAALVSSVLSFARTADLNVAPEPHPIVFGKGFSYGEKAFQGVAAVAPEVHEYHKVENPQLNRATIGVFPAYGCEFSGTETVEEAIHRFRRMLHPTTIDRAPSPVLRMRYENTKTGAGSIGPGRGYTTPDVLAREVALLEGTVGSYVEFENYEGNVWLVEWDGVWRVTGADTVVFEVSTDVVAASERVLFRGGNLAG